jgi:hypothetical protein
MTLIVRRSLQLYDSFYHAITIIKQANIYLTMQKNNAPMMPLGNGVLPFGCIDARNLTESHCITPQAILFY